ncbi:phage tail protein [Maritimibacter sp. DP07]|uniref:Phage tail protein n=1 Tax=Maritimibacter harenae TaxID=2606218 RepID=A0A845M2G5_9RHOB|nr:phage tail tube protein [Maritimibacter harenae]MZR14225.1 phage tail protein [Maritimibacter harenae]
MGQIGYGASISCSDTDLASPDANSIGEVVNITPPSPTRDIIDVTHMGSPNTAREFIVGLIDYGECQFEINWNPQNATDSLLQGIGVEDLPRDYKLTFALTGGGTATCTFRGYLTGYERSAPVDDKMAATVTLKVTGAPVWA